MSLVKPLFIDGDYMVVGALNDDGHSGSNTGAIYIYKRHGASWTLEQEISDQETGFTNLQTNDYFGHSVALSGNTLAVGAYGDDGSGSDQQYGAVYVFTRSGSTWSLQKEISSTSTVSGFTR